VRQYWTAPVSPFQIADGAALASSTTLTDISATPNIVLPANFLEVGMTLWFTAWGRFSTTATPTLLLGLYYGAVAGVAVCATSAVTTPSGVTNQTWRFEGEARVRSVGSSGTIIGVGVVENISTVATNMAPATAPATATIDTTAAKALTIGAQWGTNSASNTITCHHFAVEVG
jgi:hypothetical protein